MRFVKILGLITVLLVTLGLQSAYADDDVVSDAGKAKVNWTKKEMVFTGDGAPNLNAPNAASARLGAERAARLMAVTKALEYLKGVKINASETVGNKMEKQPGIEAEVRGFLNGFFEKEKRYFSDGGVQVDIVVPLDGPVTKAIFKEQLKKSPEKKAEPAKAEEKKPEPKAEAAVATAEPAEKKTGLVVIAEGFRVIPVLAPKIIDEDGKDVYDVTMVTEGSIDNGIVSYTKSSDKAKVDKKVADIPLVVKAIKSPNSVDLVVSNADAQKIRQVASSSSILSEGRVIIVKKKK